MYILIISILGLIAQWLYHPAYTPQQIRDYLDIVHYHHQLLDDWRDIDREEALVGFNRRYWLERRN